MSLFSYLKKKHNHDHGLFKLKINSLKVKLKVNKCFKTCSIQHLQNKLLAGHVENCRGVLLRI